jgi:hypothetical protein
MSSVPTSNEDFLIGPVADFQIRLFQGNTQIPSPPVRVAPSGLVGSNATLTQPLFAEISLTLLDSTGQQRLEDGLSLEQVKKSFGRTLVRRISLGTPNRLSP